MKRSTLLIAASLTGVLLATSVASPALAWHPKGKIQKSVQNQTAGGALSDANTAATAVNAKSGDVLKYVITVSNVAEPAAKNDNDMAKTVMTDALPAGVALINDPSQTKISENLGTLKPGQKVTKEYLVKVTSEKDGQIIVNQACFTGDSAANDNPQKGCDAANIKVSVPPKPETPTTPEQPKTEPQVQGATTTTPAPEALPETGPESIVAIVAAVLMSAAVYATYMTRFKRRANR